MQTAVGSNLAILKVENREKIEKVKAESYFTSGHRIGRKQNQSFANFQR